MVLNEGNEPTFYSRRWGTSTHTDAIFAGPETSQFFSGFKVRDVCCPSDHASLEIRLHLGTTPSTEEMFDFESMTREQKKEFKEAMEIKSGPEIGCEEKVVWDQYTDKEYGYEDMETFSLSLESDIKEELAGKCPTKTIKPLEISKKALGENFKSERCKQLLKQIRAINNYNRMRKKFPLKPGQKWRENASDERRKELQKEYFEEFRKNNEKSKRDYLDSVESSKSIGKLNRELKSGSIQRTNVPLFPNDDGSEKSREETYETLSK